MSKFLLSLISTFSFLLLVSIAAAAQQGDVALAFGTVTAPSSVLTSTTYTQGLGGGNYLGFNGDFLFKGHLGFQAEVNWRTSQALYGGQTPYRPIFYDFNAIYVRRFSKFVGAEALGGIGALSSRFYGAAYAGCDLYGNCSNYQSSNHFLVDAGGGVRLYVYHSFFVRPEARFYLIHNNVEYTSNHALRYGVSIGYSFGGTP